MAWNFPTQGRQWVEKLSRSSYFFGALLLHLVIFLMVATWVIFPAFHPPTEDFTKTYLPPSGPPPPPPPPQVTAQVSTHAITPPSIAIVSPNAAAPAFSVPLPDLTPATTPDTVTQKMEQKIVTQPNTISEKRLAKILETERGWGRDKSNIEDSNSDPRNVTAKFPVYLASYADGDWGCNNYVVNGIVDSGSPPGKIDSGSLPNLVAKINEWSHEHIKAEVVPTPLDIGGSDLLDKKPPFIFFTGHKDFVLTDQEVQNLREYLQVGGAIWGDNALPGRGSRFDIAFHREMKRVVPDLDKTFQPVPLTYDVYTKSWFPISKVPEGMNYYSEPLEHLDIDGQLAILYTPNDYSDLFTMRMLPGDTEMQGIQPTVTSPLFTPGLFFLNRNLFFRNYTMPSVLASQQLGMNIVGYMIVRFDHLLLLTN